MCGLRAHYVRDTLPGGLHALAHVTFTTITSAKGNHYPAYRRAHCEGRLRWLSWSQRRRVSEPGLQSRRPSSDLRPQPDMPRLPAQQRRRPRSGRRRRCRRSRERGLAGQDLKLPPRRWVPAPVPALGCAPGSDLRPEHCTHVGQGRPEPPTSHPLAAVDPSPGPGSRNVQSARPCANPTNTLPHRDCSPFYR